MISTCLRRVGLSGVLRPRFGMNHIKDMHEENARARLQEKVDAPAVQHYDRVYKPTYTVEFNREGEVLLYSANPATAETVYFKYPYIFCTRVAMQTSPSSRWRS